MTDYSNVYIAACGAICTSAMTGIQHEVHCVACMTQRGIIEKEEESLNRLCCGCRNPVPDDWEYAACKECGETEYAEYDYEADDRHYDARSTGV